MKGFPTKADAVSFQIHLSRQVETLTISKEIWASDGKSRGERVTKCVLCIC